MIQHFIRETWHIFVFGIVVILVWCVSYNALCNKNKIEELEEEIACVKYAESSAKEIPTKIVFSLQELQQEIDVLRIRIDELEEASERKQTIEK